MPDKRKVSLEEAEAMSRDLGRMIASAGQAPDVVVGLARGGLFPATIAAREAGVDYMEMHVERRVSRIKNRLRHMMFVYRFLPALSRLRIVRRITRYFDTKYNSVEDQSRNFGRMDVRGRHIMLVDDCVDSGLTAHYARQILIRNGAKSVGIAVLCWGTKYDSEERYALAPDHFLERGIPIFPWSFNHEEYGRFQNWLKTRAREWRVRGKA